ncbi:MULTISPECIES: hypothetical protein [unclassified Thioalkalivibrio]|uniref:hypothetical protein n=1 Tax=unclassified Thioalkalivibrio TaxID=2621013 RepID=UPI00037708C7|nr:MULTISPECIES: hypothetical protein [unclassified Thioalkalivibrio]
MTVKDQAAGDPAAIGSEPPSYRSTVQKLVKRYGREKAKGERWTPKSESEWIDVAEWLRDEVRQGISFNTWKLYRCAIRAAAGSGEEVSKIVGGPAANKKGMIEKQGSALRRKYLSAEDFAALEKYLKKSRSEFARDVLIFLAATKVTGLRPAEWVDAKWVREEVEGVGLECVRVRSRKRTNAAKVAKIQGLEIPFLPERWVPVGHLDEHEQRIVLHQIKEANRQHENGTWEEFYERCRYVLSRASVAVFGYEAERVTFYSARHQYAATLKRSGLSQLSQMLIVGHTSDATARHHYGRTVKGEASVLAEDEVADFDRMIRSLNGFGILNDRPQGPREDSVF